MKGKKSIAIFLTIAIITLALTACSNQAPTAVNEEDKMKGELSVYYVDYSDQNNNGPGKYALTQLLLDLQKEHPDLVINPTAFGNRDSFMGRTVTELSAGKGPDLLLIDYSSKLDWNKMAKNGIYEDLSKYIKKDSTYDEVDYNQYVMDAGKMDGKQYILPLAYNVLYMTTSSEKLAENNISLPDKYGYLDILNAIDTAVEVETQGGDVIPIDMFMGRNDFLTCFMQAFGMPFVDYEKGRPSIDKDSFKILCDNIKKFYPYMQEALNNKTANGSRSTEGGKVIFTLNGYSYAQGFIKQKAMKEHFGENIQTIFMPKYNSAGENSAYVSYYVAVNSNSSSKQLAYNASRALMDLAGGYNIEQKFPINNDALDTWAQDYLLGGQHGTPIDNVSIPIAIKEEEAQDMLARIEEIKHVSNESITVMDIVNDGMMPYIEGTGTFDDCYDETVNKLNLYINE